MHFTSWNSRFRARLYRRITGGLGIGELYTFTITNHSLVTIIYISLLLSPKFDVAELFRDYINNNFYSSVPSQLPRSFVQKDQQNISSSPINVPRFPKLVCPSLMHRHKMLTRSKPINISQNNPSPVRK